METERHLKQMILLIQSLQDGWPGRRDFYVGGNMALYFSETQAKNQDFRAPDFFVVRDVEDLHERLSWVVWEEDGRMPDVVIELLSASTESIDRGRKRQIYERVLRVPFYGLYDPTDARFEAYGLDGQGRYQRLPEDEHGRVWCAPLGVYLGRDPRPYRGGPGPWLRWIGADGEVFLAGDERARVESERAARESERAARESERAARAEEELARLRAELAARG